MQVEFRALLLAYGPLAALVGARIDWGVSAQGAKMPRVTLQLIGDNGQGYTFEGGDGLFEGRVQVGCYGENYGEAAAVAGAVKALLDGYRADGFRGVFCVSERDEYSGGVYRFRPPIRQTTRFQNTLEKTMTQFSLVDIGYGTKIRIGRGGGPAWTNIMGAEKASVPSQPPEDIDVTHFESPGRTRETMPGMKGVADYGLELQYWTGSPTDVLLQELSDLTGAGTREPGFAGNHAKWRHHGNVSVLCQRICAVDECG